MFLGNRKTAGETGLSSTTPNAGDDDYVANQLNQYASKENNLVRLAGTAATGANVAVVGTRTAVKRDHAWGADLVPSNSTAPVTGTAQVYAAIPGTPDVVGSGSKPYFVPPVTQNLHYDADGNLDADGVWAYAYDAENRLVSMTTLLPAGVGHKRWNLSFVYDYLGRRVQKTATNLDTTTDPTPSYTRRYIYNGWNLVAELDSTGTTLKRSYTWGLDLAGSFSATGGVGALLQVTDHTVNRNYFTAYDHNGNVTALTRDDGVLAAAYEYGPFGEPMRADVNPADTTMQDNSFRFSTKFTDAESGLVYYGKRFYSPSFGRFIIKDPIEEAGGVNLYGFVANNPVSRLDVLGMLLQCTYIDKIYKDGHIETQFLGCVEVNMGGTGTTDNSNNQPNNNAGSTTAAPNNADKDREKRKKDCATLKGMMGVYANIGRGQLDEIGVTGRELNKVGDYYAYGGLAVVTAGSIFDTIRGAYKAGAEAVEQVKQFNGYVDGTPFLIHEVRENWKSGYAASVELSTYATEGLSSGVKELTKWASITTLVQDNVSGVLSDTISEDIRSLSLNHSDTLNRLRQTNKEFKDKGCNEFY